MGRDHFEFIPVEDFRSIQELTDIDRATPLEKPLEELQALIAAQDNDESKYQGLLHRHPWVFGAQYSAIQRHETLDDKNIPDFTGVRLHGQCRDILEIKPPFTPLFRTDGNFNAKFGEYWDQAERYLDFVQRYQDYLWNSKGLRFDNPKCYLILGYKPTNAQINSLRRKARVNPSITLLTYDDLVAFMRGTISFIRNRQAEDDYAKGSIE